MIIGLSFFLSLSLSLEIVDPIVVSCLLPLGKSFAWEEEGGVWRLLMCECEDEKRGTLFFEQPSSPEHRLSDLYSMALPQHTDDILKLATFQTGNGEQTVGIVHGDTVCYISTTMMANL
ncbi:hypothetical protein CY35_03G001800 [Sphagnum magellanicum]|nr:hypothetical protein CY35_03G001800 [Sphagnum magellanicum]